MGRRARFSTVERLSALGAGILLALAPQCAGSSLSSSSDDSGGTGTASGGASGSDGARGGTSSGKGSGGVSSGGTGGVATGGFGAMCFTGLQGACFTAAQLANCAPWDGGLDAAIDGGDDGSDGAAGEAGGMLPPRPGDAGADADASGMPTTFDCPTGPQFPGCVVMAQPPASFRFELLGWDGTECCYTFYVMAC